MAESSVIEMGEAVKKKKRSNQFRDIHVDIAWHLAVIPTAFQPSSR